MTSSQDSSITEAPTLVVSEGVRTSEARRECLLMELRLRRFDGDERPQRVVEDVEPDRATVHARWRGVGRAILERFGVEKALRSSALDSKSRALNGTAGDSGRD